MHLLLRMFLFFIVAIQSFEVPAETIIKSSVSPEFPSGLHTKYLNYIAKKLELPLEIIPMPYARRLIELKKGNLNLAVGFIGKKQEGDYITILEPPYGRFRHAIFVLKGKSELLKNKNDISKLIIGLTNSSKYYSFFNQHKKINTYGVNSLRQKIKMLLKGRIDAFVHFEESTKIKLKLQGLQNEIELAKYQPFEYENYYFAISSASHLMNKKIQLEQIIKDAINNKDLTKIRKKHYGTE